MLPDDERILAVSLVGSYGIAANQYMCREFIRRGTDLAKQAGERWPVEFVDATLARLQRHFGTDFD